VRVCEATLNGFANIGVGMAFRPHYPKRRATAAGVRALGHIPGTGGVATAGFIQASGYATYANKPADMPPERSCCVPEPGFAAQGGACGADGYMLSSPEELEEPCHNAFASGWPTVIKAHLTRRQMPRSSPSSAGAISGLSIRIEERVRDR
jgi:hypothetical protein